MVGVVVSDRRYRLSRERKIGVMAVSVAVLMAVFSVVGGENQDEQLGTLWFTVPFAIIAGALVFAWLVPWAKRTAPAGANRPVRTGLVMSVLGLLSIVAFWSGLPVILGAGGVALGQTRREDATAGHGGISLAAVALGALAVAGGIAVVAFDKLGI